MTVTFFQIMCLSKDKVQCPSTCPPFLSTQACALVLMALIARRITPLCCRRASTSAMILSRRSPMSRGGVVKTLLFRYPHKKKSHGVRSGDLGGHSVGWCTAKTLLWNSSLSLSLTMTLWTIGFLSVPLQIVCNRSCVIHWSCLWCHMKEENMSFPMMCTFLKK